MRKIIVQDMVTIDGYFAGAKGNIGWHNVDDEFVEYANGNLNNTDMLLFGHVTYDLMNSYWPTPDAIKNSAVTADKMNSLPKIVFSATLPKADWNNTKVLHSINKEEIVKMKEGGDKDIVIFGSGTIVVALTELGLIDEYRLLVNPVVLGEGKSLFAGLKEKLNLKLIDTKTFNSGNVLLHYQRV